MINQELFLQHMALIADRVGRQLAGPTQREYHRQLSAALTTEQFIAAASIAFNTWNAEFRNWPSPAQLIALVIPPTKPALSALEAFELVLSSMTNDPRVTLPEQRQRVEKIGDVAYRAFHAAGGIREFSGILEADVPWLRKRFVECYDAALLNADDTHRATLALADADSFVAGLISNIADQKAMPGTQRRIAS